MYGGISTEMWMHRDESHPQATLQSLVWDELRSEPELDTSVLSVEVEEFVATLAGSVPDYPSKRAVEQAAERVLRIRAVVNDLTVTLRAADARADSVLAAAVANALVWDVRVPHVRLTAAVRDGWVTLAGTVARGAERVAAEDAVENLTGVRGVTNDVLVVPAAGAVDVQARAVAALARAGAAGKTHIDLEARGSTVVLRGRVHSLAERLAAERAVWAVPGVAAVEDLLTVR